MVQRYGKPTEMRTKSLAFLNGVPATAEAGNRIGLHASETPVAAPLILPVAPISPLTPIPPHKYYDRKNKYYDRKSYRCDRNFYRCDRKNGDYTCSDAGGDGRDVVGSAFFRNFVPENSGRGG